MRTTAMRLFIIIISLLLFVSCSKYTALEGTYFSDKQDCFMLDGKEGLMEAKDQNILDRLSLKQAKNKIKFRSVTRSHHRFFYTKNVYKYYFKILYRAEASFIVSPASKLSKQYYSNRKNIVFKTKFCFADQTNYFNRIIYHSGRCFGFCNDLHLELDKSGNLKVTDNGNGRTDSAKNDNYIGKLSYEDLERLNTILKYAQLKTLEWPAGRHCFDLPDLTIILYQNDKRYYFKMNAACLPMVSRELTRFLSSLFKYENLKKVSSTFEYEH